MIRAKKDFTSNKRPNNFFKRTFGFYALTADETIFTLPLLYFNLLSLGYQRRHQRSGQGGEDGSPMPFTSIYIQQTGSGAGN